MLGFLKDWETAWFASFFCSFLFLPLVFLFCAPHVMSELFSWDPLVPRETSEHQKPLGSAVAIRDSKLKIEDP